MFIWDLDLLCESDNFKLCKAISYVFPHCGKKKKNKQCVTLKDDIKKKKTAELRFR